MLVLGRKLDERVRIEIDARELVTYIIAMHEAGINPDEVVRRISPEMVGEMAIIRLRASDVRLGFDFPKIWSVCRVRGSFIANRKGHDGSDDGEGGNGT